jgi:pyruvate dehydrogenase E1 component alpha subunit
MSDPAKYRKDGELEQKKERDGIKSAANRLREDFGVTDAELEQVKKDIEEEAQDAYSFAEQGDDPDPATLYDYTYAPTPTHGEG